MTNVPNLYEFATKELAQDATLAYILAWADPKYRESHSRLHELGTAMLRALLTANEAHILDVTSLKVQTQVSRIDVLVLVNDDQNGLALLIEDKVDSHEHSNQIERYIEAAKELHPRRKIVPVYVKTGNTSRAYLPDKTKCGHFLRQNILGILNQYRDTGDAIVDNFRVYLQNWEDETNRYREEPFSKWEDNWMRYEGFYMDLERRMEKDDSAGWEYVSNAAGGLLCFTFAWTEITDRQQPFRMYFQIEAYPDPDESRKNRTRLTTRLTLRLGDWDGPGIESPLMWEVFELLKGEGHSEFDGLGIEKAGRFRGGASAAVVKFTFGDKTNGYLALNAGIVDSETTMKRLDRVRGVIDKLSSCLHVSA